TGKTTRENQGPNLSDIRVCPHIGIRGGPTQTSAAADWNKGQFAGHATISGQNSNYEPVTLTDRNVSASWASGVVGGACYCR
ncbi:MAG: hypothetical protein QHJ82_17340, partial [Verrucomicrobiota bacterium]|nr:hypothetical protein [Verrucomicrobiota bacterium]